MRIEHFDPKPFMEILEKMKVIQLRAKPVEVSAIQWNNNEPEIRQFVGDDKLLRFPNSRFEIWNDVEGSWINVPMFHYVIRGIKGELNACSPEILEKSYELISDKPDET